MFSPQNEPRVRIRIGGGTKARAADAVGLPEEGVRCKFSPVQTLELETWLGMGGPGQPSPLVRVGRARKCGTAVVWGCQGKVWISVFSPADSFPCAMAKGLVPCPRCKTARVFVCPVFQQKLTGADKTLHIKTDALYESKSAQKI